ncbi:MAG TPA: hypothetical protein VN838_27725 [Bradyrhizobium sp.]|nr:hypothetical protein [Bradyrhizobium sp.]
MRRSTLCGKLKRQATAAFLGVFTFPQHVVGVCCIPTTIFGWNSVGDRTQRDLGDISATNPGPNPELTVNGTDRPLRFGATTVGRTEKAAANATAFHDSDNLTARARAAPIAP